MGISLGGNLRKIRLAIRSKDKGKSGGARVITYIYLEGGRVHLLAAYDKADRDSISDDELSQLVSDIEMDQ